MNYNDYMNQNQGSVSPMAMPKMPKVTGPYGGPRAPYQPPKPPGMTPPKGGAPEPIKLPADLEGDAFIRIIDAANQKERPLYSVENASGSYTLENGLVVSKEAHAYLVQNGFVVGVKTKNPERGFDPVMARPMPMPQPAPRFPGVPSPKPKPPGFGFPGIPPSGGRQLF